MPNQTQIVNQVLNELGRLPVTDITLSQDTVLISNKIDVLLPELLLRTDWNFAIKFVVDNTPLTVPISTEYPYNYQLPPDYNRIDRMSWFAVNFGLIYRIIDNVIMTNTKPIQYYYVTDTVDLSKISDTFYRALVLYVASASCMAITQDEKLAAYLKLEYREKLADAVRQNDMDRMITTTPYNDFNRSTYI